MSSKPHCFVHIGAPKTGSTAIQRFLFENREALRERAMLYPDANLRGYGHHDLAFLLSGGYPAWAIPQPKPLAEIAAELRAAGADHGGSIVLSSENFYLFPAPTALRALLNSTGASIGRQIGIIVYVRRQDDAHESWYNQTVKAQGGDSRHRYLRSPLARPVGLRHAAARLGGGFRRNQYRGAAL